MRRDLDLIREILLAVEGFEPQGMSETQGLNPATFSGSEPQNLHHIELLIKAGYIEKSGGQDLKTGTHYVDGMTMEGHDFLDAVRETSVWEATKTKLDTVGGWTLDIVLAVAKEELKRRFLGVTGG